MNGLMKLLPGFLKKYGGWILTGLGCVGFIGTTVLVANESPKVEEAYAEARTQKAIELGVLKDEEAFSKMLSEGLPELTIREKFDIAAPVYLPAFLVGMTTIGCMIGAQIFNAKQQAALVGAYALLADQFNQYRKEVREEVGEEREKELYILSRQKIKELQAKIKQLETENAPQLYAIATLPGVIFESRPEHIANVFHGMLFNLINCGAFSLEEMYKHIGIPKDVYNSEEADEYGWDMYENEVTYGQPCVEFEIMDIQRRDGKIIHLISTSVPPYKLGMNYGSTDSSVDYLYEGFNCERAMFLAQASIDADVERFETPDIWIQHSW